MSLDVPIAIGTLPFNAEPAIADMNNPAGGNYKEKQAAILKKALMPVSSKLDGLNETSEFLLFLMR